ncbi:hypothetical protein CB0940_11056 [Cercospora beticola]|uniref:Tyrosine specific protein phosphatases domain-containing protein n=1 Tax=Cercospora beticola TaxID=122368 RepID=A0A2G5HD91_CERBT|nr:hypothetical protein CB0940_11056 [Cercospora beticola]PIA90517.1 hypothetical protein CB0940_11056 [Cercospora beticola]WPB07885.1 hypothetical protein RHO25_012549 [Cercospora beticola]CAK1368274.1 unnamed protein product [Cercospora beticola]
MPGSQLPVLEKVANLRDVALSTASPLLKPGLLLRSAAPDDATPNDRNLLASELGLQTIIDLRSDTEHREVIKKNALRVPPVPDPPVKEHPAQDGINHTAPQDPARIPGVKYELINFNGSAYTRHLIWQLSYFNIAKLLTWYTLGYSNDAISIIATNVMQKRGLVGLAQDSLHLCKAEVRLVFDVLASKESYPLLVHCTQGKDRTGLVILLVLMLLGVDHAAIEKDYMLSEQGLALDRDKRVEAITKVGFPDEFADCAKDWAQTVIATIEKEHGGIEKYLTSCEVDVAQQKQVRESLSQDVA